MKSETLQRWRTFALGALPSAFVFFSCGGSTISMGDQDDAGNAGGSTISTGAGGGVGTGGHGTGGTDPDAADCDALLRNAKATLEAARACDSNSPSPTLCKGMVYDVCHCPTSVGETDSDATRSYLMAFDAFQKSGCSAPCTNGCLPNDPAKCEPSFVGPWLCRRPFE